MRSQWVPVSASALITGTMALVLAQLLNPSGGNESPAAVFQEAGNHSGRWLAMSVLFFGGAACLVLGMPAVLGLFTGRGRRLGLLGVAVFSVGALGVAGLSAVMLMFRALSLDEAVEPQVIGGVLEDDGLQVMIAFWVYSFLAGVLLIAAALFRSRVTPLWVPGLLVIFLLLQLLPGDGGRVLGAVGLMAMVAGFTGVAIRATSPENETVTDPQG